MSDTNVNDLIQNLDNVNQSLSRLTSAYRSAARDTGPFGDSLRSSTQAVRAEADSRKKSIDQFKADVANFGSSVTSSLKGIAGGSTSFTQLSSVMSTAISTVGSFGAGIAKLIPVFGEGIASLITAGSKALSDASQIVVQQFETGFNAFKQASKVGAVNTFNELQDSATKLNLRMEQLSTVYAANSENLAAIGGSAIAGTKLLDQLGDSSKDLRDQFMRLGTSSDEFAGLQIGMMTNFKRAGYGLKDIDKIQKDYMSNLDAISQLTGKSKEEIQKQRNEREKEFRFQVRMNELAGGDKAKATKLKGQFDLIEDRMSPEDAKALKALFGTGGRVLDKNMAADVTRMGPGAREFMERMSSKEGVTDLEVQQFAKEQSRKIVEKWSPYAQTLSNAAIMPQSSSVIANANRDIQDPEQLKADREKAAKDDKSKTAQLADTATALQKTSVDLQVVATSSNAAAGAMRFAAETMQKLTESIKNVLGVGSSSTAVRPAGANAAAGQTTANEGGAIIGVTRNSRPVVPGSLRAIQQANAAASASPASGGNRGADLSGLPIKSSESTAGGPTPPDLAALAKTIHKTIGGDLTQFTAFDDAYHRKNKPDSKHAQGRALDFTINDPSKSESIANMVRGLGVAYVKDEYKFPSPGSTGGHIHAALAEGGITSGPSLAGEAGPEAVVPLPDGRTIPVKIGNWDELIGVWARIEDRLTQLVDLSEGQNSIQRKQLQFARN